MSRLLIVTPDGEMCEKIKNIVTWSHYGFSLILTASSFEEAVNLALDMKPHAALVEMDLGEHRGYELAPYIHLSGMKTSVCILADSPDAEKILASLRGGAQDYLTKPLTQEAVIGFLERRAKWYTDEQEKSCLAMSGQIDPVLNVEYRTLSKITNRLISYVREECRAPHSLTAIAECLHMSSKYIGRIFLRDTGMKFSQYLTAYRMLEARKLIIGTNEKISVIANMVGYSQQNNFYTHFKDYFGVSPGYLRDSESESRTRITQQQGENYEKSI